MTSLQQHIEDSLEKVIPEIIKILSYQANITAQGINYTGEKDWALNKIKALIEQSLLEQADILRGEVEKLDRYYDNSVDIRDVLDLFKINQE